MSRASQDFNNTYIFSLIVRYIPNSLYIYETNLKENKHEYSRRNEFYWIYIYCISIFYYWTSQYHMDVNTSIILFKTFFMTLGYNLMN